MEVSNKIVSLIKGTFSEVVNALANNYQGTLFDDILITVDKESGEVSFYDDEENCINSIVIHKWISQPDLPDEKIAGVLRTVVGEMDNNDEFSPLDIYKPFSISYVDENMDIIEEILVIDDDTDIQSDNDLLKKFDKEFDEFLDKLLNE